MNYEFPIITSIDDVLPAISGAKEFNVYEKDWGYVINYQVCFADTFPEVKTVDHAIRRECRGIKFDKNGKILARPYSKFFNLGERIETGQQAVDFSKKFHILDKLDGSMVHPIFFGKLDDIDGDNLDWCTKMGPTDVSAAVYDFVSQNKHYARYSAHIMANNMTPIFEWCTNKNRIVVSYPNDRLVLTAIRNNFTGEYLPYEDLLKAETHGIEVVKAWNGTFTDIAEFADHVKGLEGIEGYIIRFHDGHMLKIKNLWYLQLHKVKELMQNEKEVWKVILDDSVDDALGFMEQEDKNEMLDMQRRVITSVNETAERLYWEVQAWVDNKGDGRKKFATEFVQSDKFNTSERSVLFRVFNDGDPTLDVAKDAIRDYVYGRLGTAAKLVEAKKLLKWYD